MKKGSITNHKKEMEKKARKKALRIMELRKKHSKFNAVYLQQKQA